MLIDTQKGHRATNVGHSRTYDQNKDKRVSYPKILSTYTPPREKMEKIYRVKKIPVEMDTK